MVTIVIVNWNAGALLREAVLSSLTLGSDLVRSIVVVDNASTDQSLASLSEFSDPRLRVIRNATNVGFAAACNAGARTATSPFILFLNPDAKVLPGALESVCEFMAKEENAAVGIAGVQLVDANNLVARTCARFPKPIHFATRAVGADRLLRSHSHFLNEWDHGDTRVVDQVMGAFFFVRRDVFRELGGFDEDYFVYFEEMDFSRRAKDRGWHSVFIADARAFHLGNGTTDTIRATRLFYSLRSRAVYAGKHFSRANAALVLSATLALEPFARLAQCALRGSLADAAAVVAGYFHLSRWLLSGDRRRPGAETSRVSRTMER